MGAIVRGRRFAGPYYVDNVQGTSGYLNIQPLASGVTGMVYDLLSFQPHNANVAGQNAIDGTIVYPNEIGVQVRIINASGGDGYHLTTKIRFSHDGSDWPDIYEGTDVGTYTDAAAGADLNWSNQSVVTAQERFLQFGYTNFNLTNPVTVATRIFPKW